LSKIKLIAEDGSQFDFAEKSPSTSKKRDNKAKSKDMVTCDLCGKDMRRDNFKRGHRGSKWCKPL
jgi:hypothetical protein